MGADGFPQQGSYLPPWGETGLGCYLNVALLFVDSLSRKGKKNHEMRRWQRYCATLFVGCLLVVAPVSSTYTAGLIGVGSLCAQETPVERCIAAWRATVTTADALCLDGQVALCSVGCDPETGDYVWSECVCGTPTPDDVGDGGGTE